jgi:hypothetical protein
MGYREARHSNASDEGGESGVLTVRVPLGPRHYDWQHASPTAGARGWAIGRLDTRTRATKEVNLAC